jgi:NDP-sugar pyrophosphorylase family protein
MEQVVILSGGLATRMRPITETVPKALIELTGKPFVCHQLKLLKSKGVSHAVMCLGYLGYMIEDYVGDGSRFGLSVKYSYDGETPLGTGGALKKAEKLLDNVFFVLYGDSYLDTDYAAVSAAFASSGKSGLMTVYKNENQWDQSNVIYENNELIKYSKRDRFSEMNYIDYGLGMLRREALCRIEPDTVCDLAGLYEGLSEERRLMGFEVFSRFYEIGSKTGLAELSRLLEEQNGR